MSILFIAYLLFVANFLYGVLVATGAIERGRWRRVHHILYFLTMIGIAAATLDAIIRGRPPFLPAAVAILLLGMTRFRGGSKGHSMYAGICLVAYSLVVYGGTWAVAALQ